MKAEQINAKFYGINENAYLSEEEETKVVEFALKNIEEKNMSFEESEEYLRKFPIPRMFIRAYRGFLGEEEYKLLEQKNSELILKRAWEND